MNASNEYCPKDPLCGFSLSWKSKPENSVAVSSVLKKKPNYDIHVPPHCCHWCTNNAHRIIIIVYSKPKLFCIFMWKLQQVENHSCDNG